MADRNILLHEAYGEIDALTAERDALAERVKLLTGLLQEEYDYILSIEAKYILYLTVHGFAEPWPAAASDIGERVRAVLEAEA